MRGLKFRRQHVVAGVIVDFYCAELRLVLEVDGDIHTMPDHMASDAVRTSHLEARGLRVIRIANADVSAEAVQRLLRGILSSSPSPRRGEGVRG
jgi:very-short-patch-repair endonuclease